MEIKTDMIYNKVVDIVDNVVEEPATLLQVLVYAVGLLAGFCFPIIMSSLV